MNDVVRIERMTRSGQCYTLNFLGVKEGEKSTKEVGVKAANLKKKEEEPRNELVTEAEANEFLKFIKHSEYNIIEQLHKMLAKIYLLALLLNSKPYKEAMLKVLS